MAHDSNVNRNNTVLSLQGSSGGGAVNLEAGHADSEGFYVALAPDATEGLLKVTFLEGSEAVLFPFFKGATNPYLLKEIHVDEGNTATSVYWYK